MGDHQPGIIHTWTFDQRDKWVDVEGTEHQLADMSREYIGNVIAFLLRNARRFHWAWYTDREKKTLGAISACSPDEPDALADFDPEAFQNAPMIEQTKDKNSVLWMLDRPLVDELMKQWRDR